MENNMKNVKVYLLTHWFFNECTVMYVTFDIEVAKKWESEEPRYGYHEYEEVDVYENKEYVKVNEF